VKSKYWSLVFCIIGLNPDALAVTRFVNASNATPASPYTSWATAATSIQSAVDIAAAGDLILVTNGVYQTGGKVVYGQMSNRVAITKSLIVQSVNGPAVTVIQGFQIPGTTNGNGAVRCVYLTNNATLSGFTLTNGATRNYFGDFTQEQSGGGVWCQSFSSVVSNCVLTGNSAYWDGGGAYAGTLKNCIIQGNISRSDGGGAYNSALTNCAIVGNIASLSGGGTYGGTLVNCTLAANSATSGGGLYLDPFAIPFLGVRNCLIYYNTAPQGPNYSGVPVFISFSCTTPLPSGTGNFTNEPALASLTHLSAVSPCRGAGSGAFGLDIDGETWLNPPSIGCDEYRTGSVTGLLSVASQASYTNIAVGFTVDFNALIDGRTSASRWDFGDGTIISNRVFVSHSWSTPGDYSVELKAFNESNPLGVSATTVVHVFAQSVHYVSLQSTNSVAPYSSWETAATNINDAIDATSLPGALVLVAVGIYNTGGRSIGVSNRVAITKPVIVQSVKGPADTIIQGYRVPGTTFGTSAVRCVYLADQAALAGFTLTNGVAGSSGNGGGAYCATSRALLSNCVLAGNTAFGSGGGVYQGTLKNCAIFDNSSWNAGGGASAATLNNCTITANSAMSGGGASGCALNNCIVFYNFGSSLPNFTGGTLNYSCSTPLPSGGVGNIGVEPGLASLFHLAAGSLCKGAGNSAFASGFDIDGESWPNVPSIGCDEFYPGALIGPLSVSIEAPYTNLATGFSATFIAQIFGQISASRWNFGDGTIVSNRPVAMHSWSTPGDYSVSLQTFTADNPGGMSATVTLHVVSQQIAYVALESLNPVVPYDSWATAATNIQDAVDVVYAGGLVLVSNGVYQTGGRVIYGSMTNRLTVTRPVTVQSVNGPEFTVIMGAQSTNTTTGDGAVRGAYLADGGSLAGFTLTNGGTRAIGDTTHEETGGGVWCWSVNANVSNCVIAANSAGFFGGGARSGTFDNCVFLGNSSSFEGGGAYSGVFYNCAFNSNSATFGGGGETIIASNCVFNGNTASDGGGVDFSVVFDSILSSNSATFGGAAWSGSLINCLVLSNSASAYGGGTDAANLTNCTVVGNSATYSGGGTDSGSLYNCIVFYNTSPSGSNYDFGTLNYCCTIPAPSNGSGNITNEPMFADITSGNLRLESSSPCINSGKNTAVNAGPDLDGYQRIVGGTVDIGAYEFRSPQSLISYAWLQQFGLATDGSADFLDTDSDGMNNWQEWIAGTDPTNPDSALRMLNPTINSSNIVVRWQSVSGRKYFVQRATTLAAQPAFLTIVTNITGVSGTDTYTDRPASIFGPNFYRVGVQP
jgi:PKD repeat protein